MHPFSYHRITIIGTTGSGKTFLARKLSALIGIPLYSLDKLNSPGNDNLLNAGEFRDKVAHITKGEQWIIDGSYKIVQDVIWPKADLIIWLDYPLYRVLFRQALRVIRKSSREAGVEKSTVGDGNTRKKTVWEKLSSYVKLVVGTVRKHSRNRREYPLGFDRLGISASVVLHFKSPAETAKFLEAIQKN